MTSRTRKKAGHHPRQAPNKSRAKGAAVSKTRSGPARRLRRGGRGRASSTRTFVIVGAAVAVLAVLFVMNRGGSGTKAKYPFQVGQPGPGLPAPGFSLESTTGGTIDLSSFSGKTVLLYFQEGLTCQPCWDQLKDIDSQMSQFKALGVDQVIGITTDPIDALKQKVSDQGITSPVLSDADLSVSSAYGANSYGMMGTSRDGHTFIAVGPDGQIEWRADYGGAPNFTMFLPVPNLLSDLRRGLGSSTS